VKRPGYVEALSIKEELEHAGDGTADSLVDELTERGTCFRFTHRWPMLIQLVYAMDKEKLTRSALFFFFLNSTKKKKKTICSKNKIKSLQQP
jgi:hypothetical protein